MAKNKVEALSTTRDALALLHEDFKSTYGHTSGGGEEDEGKRGRGEEKKKG